VEEFILERILNIASLEIKKKNFIRGIMLGVIVLIPILVLFLIVDKSIDSSVVVHRIVTYMLLANGCFCLTQEFSNKTDRVIFTGVFKRSEIIFSKLISFFIISLIYFIFYEVVLSLYNLYMNQHISQFINIKILLNNLYVFFIYTFTLSCFILLVSVVTANSIVTGIVTYILYFDLILAIFSNVLESSSNETLKSVIRNIPFYIANTGFNNLKYTFDQSMVMIACGCIFFTLACAIINRKNI
jgi:ABC-2 type transport system permease protein